MTIVFVSECHRRATLTILGNAVWLPSSLLGLAGSRVVIAAATTTTASTTRGLSRRTVMVKLLVVVSEVVVFRRRRARAKLR